MPTEEARIVWKEKAPKGGLLFCSVPDTGLIGFIASIHTIQEMNLPLIGFVEAPWMPPIVSIFDGRPFPPVRIYGGEKISIFLSEVPLEQAFWQAYSALAVKIYEEMDASSLITATGLPNPKRQEMETLRLFAAYTDESLKKSFAPEAQIFSGVMSGPYASLIQYTLKSEVPTLIYLVDSYPVYPDPEAASVIVKMIGSIIDAELDVEKLLEKGAELRIKARQLALETQKSQRGAQAQTGRAPVGFYV
ncbi:MAG: proteasome assembly chaperone family protein [Candidatus Geothermarchaeales archaeon]